MLAQRQTVVACNGTELVGLVEDLAEPGMCGPGWYALLQRVAQINPPRILQLLRQRQQVFIVQHIAPLATSDPEGTYSSQHDIISSEPQTLEKHSESQKWASGRVFATAHGSRTRTAAAVTEAGDVTVGTSLARLSFANKCSLGKAEYTN